MDYRETCRCGGNMTVSEIEDPEEVRRMVNTWRKYHACVGVRVDRETGEVTGETIQDWMEAK
jgi:hypothetical protein